MIWALFVTILIEGIVILAWCAIRKKPAVPLLFASLFINVLTQILLWSLLRIFHTEYLVTLLVTEAAIWLFESLLLFRMSNGQLNLYNASVLSFCMNAASFGVGWFLPI